MLLKPIISMLQFTTVLPLGKTVDFSYFARWSFLYPLAGYITGGIAAAASFWIPDPLIAAAVAFSALLLVTGCNHFDGLLDFGDGLMAHGGRDTRIRALTDRQIGAGAVALGLGISLLAFTGLAHTRSILPALIAAEVGAKFSMAFLTAYGKPFREGLHSFLYNQAGPGYAFIAALLCLPLLLLPLSMAQLTATGILMIAIPAALLAISTHLFGGVNGDVVGASNEITRAFILVALALVPYGSLI